MASVNYLMDARASLEALEQLLRDAAENERPVSEIADEALAHVQDALAVIETFDDEEGTQ